MKEKNKGIRVHFERISSTQEYAKEKRAEGRGLLVTAEAQTGGKGTKGRSFSSEKGGVYLSKLSFYEDFSSRDAFQIMAQAAVAVCETLRYFGLSPVIKWPNDIFVNGKKICGILIENTFSGAEISSSIVGIGLNVNNTLPKALCDIATTMQEQTGETFDVEAVTNKLIESLGMPADMQKYLSYIGYMGNKATLLLGDQLVPATLLSVDEQGGLTVEIAGELRRVTAAEVSVAIPS